MVARACVDEQRKVRNTRVEPVVSNGRARASSRTQLAATTLLITTLAAGCSQVLGFKDPRLSSGDDGGTSDGGAPDGSAGKDGAVGDAPVGVAALWIFTTNGAFQGDFGATSGGRTGADTKCGEAYDVAFMTRQCTNIHAVIQVDNVDDTLDHMAGKFQIPSGVPVLRATDATKVASQWDDVVNRSAVLLAPVSATSLPFWSGRGASANRHCNSWQSKDSTLLGDAGDASAVSSWMSQTTFACNSITPHLLCVCW